MALFSRKNIKDCKELYKRIYEIAASTIGFNIVPTVPMDDSVIYNKDNCDGTFQQEEYNNKSERS